MFSNQYLKKVALLFIITFTVIFSINGTGNINARHVHYCIRTYHIYHAKRTAKSSRALRRAEHKVKSYHYERSVRNRTIHDINQDRLNNRLKPLRIGIITQAVASERAKDYNNAINSKLGLKYLQKHEYTRYSNYCHNTHTSQSIAKHFNDNGIYGENAAPIYQGKTNYGPSEGSYDAKNAKESATL